MRLPPWRLEDILKFTIQKSAALGCLIQALETCGGKARADSGILVAVSERDMIVTATNPFAQQEISIPGYEHKAGDEAAFVIPGKQFVEWLRQSPSEEVRCEYDGEVHSLTLHTAGPRKLKYTLKTSRAKDFAKIVCAPGKQKIVVPGNVLAAALSACHPAASRDYNRRPYTAVKVVLEGATLSVEACDFERLAKYTAEIEDVGDRQEYLMPRDNAKSVASAISKAANIEVSSNDRYVIFSWGSCTFISALEAVETDRKFADTTPFVDANRRAEVVISQQTLLQALKMASLMAPDAPLTVSCDEETKSLSMQTTENDLGSGSDTVPADDVMGNAECTTSLKDFVKAVEACEETVVSVRFVEFPSGDIAICVEDGHSRLRIIVFPVVLTN